MRCPGVVAVAMSHCQLFCMNAVICVGGIDLDCDIAINCCEILREVAFTRMTAARCRRSSPECFGRMSHSPGCRGIGPPTNCSSELKGVIIKIKALFSVIFMGRLSPAWQLPIRFCSRRCPGRTSAHRLKFPGRADFCRDVLGVAHFHRLRSTVGHVAFFQFGNALGARRSSSVGAGFAVELPL